MFDKIKNFFSPSVPTPAPVGNVYEIVPVAPQPAAAIVPMTGNILLVPGKWIVWNGKIRGILVSIDSASGGWMDQVGEDGITTGTVQITMADVRVARYDEIPACRRPADPLWAATKGYF